MVIDFDNFSKSWKCLKIENMPNGKFSFLPELAFRREVKNPESRRFALITGKPWKNPDGQKTVKTQNFSYDPLDFVILYSGFF